jgi:hypothetical protein
VKEHPYVKIGLSKDKYLALKSTGDSVVSQGLVGDFNFFD